MTILESIATVGPLRACPSEPGLRPNRNGAAFGASFAITHSFVQGLMGGSKVAVTSGCQAEKMGGPCRTRTCDLLDVNVREGERDLEHPP